MNSRDRVLKALDLKVPDAVPYMYNCMDKDIQERIINKEISIETVTPLNSWGYLGKLGEQTKVDPVLTVVPEVASYLKLDAIGIQILPPLFVESHNNDGRAGISDGLLTSRDAFKKIIMPDPDNENLYKKIKLLLDRYKGNFAIYARIRLGASPTLLSMGMTGFAYNLADDPGLVEDILSMYCEWSSKVSKNLGELDFDFFWCFDDIAYKTSPIFSRHTLEEIFMPQLRKAAAAIKKPWVYHSDGNLQPILDILVDLGMNGLHPLEPGAMDLDYLKSEYGNKFCLIGNIDIDKTLSRGSENDVYNEVKERINQLGGGGGFIISDSNSVPAYCKAENVIAMSKAVEKYRYIY
jgi:Uroporphyrinogen-III decarboxylase